MGLEALADKGGFSPIRSLLGTLLRVLTCCSSEAIVGGMLSKLLALFEKSFYRAWFTFTAMHSSAISCGEALRTFSTGVS